MSLHLPEELVSAASKVGQDDWAWRRADALRVVDWAANHGVAILGGEVLVVQEDGTIWGVVPREGGGPAAVIHWAVEPGWRREEERWEDFCRRAATFSRSVLHKPDLENGVAARYLPFLRYCFTLTTEDEY